MRFGVFLLAGRHPGQDDRSALRRSLDAVLAAEAAGFDDVWIAEHHFMSYGTCPSAITFAAHALGRTTRIALGTAVSVLSTTHPVALAEQVALLDQLADGRLRLGVGRGGPWVDLEVFGTGLDRFENGFAESLDLLLAGLTQPSISAAGDHFAFREVPIVPRPWSRPHPPVVVATTSTATAELAATRGLPMLLGMHADDDEKLAMIDHYDSVARAAGRDPTAIEHISTVVAHVADSRSEARDDLRATLPGWLTDGLAGYRPVDDRPRSSRDPVEYTDMLCAMHPVGDPDYCVTRLRASAERTGVRHVIMMVEGTGSHTRTMATIARLGTEVLPRLHNSPALEQGDYN